MKPEKPAMGILRSNSYGDSIHYHVRCDCGDDDCSHHIEIELDPYFEIEVHLHTTIRSRWNDPTRWRQLWNLLTKGTAELETSIVLNEQVALNYATAMLDAVNNLKRLGKSHKNESTPKSS